MTDKVSGDASVLNAEPAIPGNPAVARFTPGPWRRNKYGSVGAGPHGTHPVIATLECFYGVDQQFGDHAANAYIIAAAPEMYAALSALLGDDFYHHPYDFSDDWHKAAAALAKARGEV